MKFKQLGNKEKIEYIWDYYKIHIIGTIVGLIFVFSMLNTLVFNREKDIGLSVVVRGQLGYYNELEVQDVTEKIQNIIEMDTSKYRVLIEDLPVSGVSDPTFVMAYESKFMAKASSDEIDLMVVSKDYIPTIIQSDIVTDLSGLVDFKNEDVIQKDGKVVGLNLKYFKELSRLIKLDIGGCEDYFVFIYAGSKNMDNTKMLFSRDLVNKD